MVVKKKEEKNSRKENIKKLELIDDAQSTLVKEERSLKTILGKRIINKEVQNEQELHKKRADAISKYYEVYKRECSIFMSHGFVIEPKVMNRCCVLLSKSGNDNYSYNPKVMAVIKTVIRSVVRDTLHLVYIYSNIQSSLRYLSSELHNNSIEFDYSALVDRAYYEVFNELREQQKGGKKYG